MKFQPTYISYNKRIWGLLRFRVYMYIALTVLLLPLKNYAFLVPLFLFIVLYKRVQKLSVQYLNELNIDIAESYLEIEVFEYDKYLLNKKISLSECDLKLNEINVGLYPLYQLEFYSKENGKHPFYKQISAGAWNLKCLIEIYELFKRAKGEKSDIGWYKKMLNEERK